MTIPADVISIANAPCDVQCAIQEFWPPEEWDNAANVFRLESDFDPFADRNTVDADHPCGTEIGMVDGVRIFAEHSVGIAQINVCNYPSWDWKRLWNVRENLGTAHAIWTERGWSAWYFSAKSLGLI